MNLMCMFLFIDHRNDEVIAAASLNYDPAASAVAERFAAGKVITKKEAQYEHFFLLFLIKQELVETKTELKGV